jgi:hypothetical protein
MGAWSQKVKGDPRQPRHAHHSPPRVYQQLPLAANPNQPEHHARRERHPQINSRRSRWPAFSSPRQSPHPPLNSAPAPTRTFQNPCATPAPTRVESASNMRVVFFQNP